MQPIRLPSLTREIELMEEEEERSPSPRLDAEPHPPHQHPKPYQQAYPYQMYAAAQSPGGGGGGGDAGAGTSAGAGARRSERWAKQSDWDAHRDIITSLYRDRGLTLKRVKETMERDYQFFSTERMYKFRLKQWGVAKYIKQRDMGGGKAAGPAVTAADACLADDYPVGQPDHGVHNHHHHHHHHDGQGGGGGAGTHSLGADYHFLVHPPILPDRSISDVALQLTNTPPPGAHRTDGARPRPRRTRRHGDDDGGDDDGRPPAPSLLPPTSRPAASSSSSSSSSRVGRSLAPAGELRAFEVCVGHARLFAASVRDEGGLGPTRSLDRSPGGGARRTGWTYDVARAVSEIHLGRVAAGFGRLDAAFDAYRTHLAAGDTAFFLQLATALALLAERSLPGLAALFLRYAARVVSVVLPPAHPFAVVARQLQALGPQAGLDVAWHVLPLYADMLWRRPATITTTTTTTTMTTTEEKEEEGEKEKEEKEGEQEAPVVLDVLSQLSWDMSRGVDRDYVGPLFDSATSGWAGERTMTALAVAQVQIGQRRHASARRTVDDALRRHQYYRHHHHHHHHHDAVVVVGQAAPDPVGVALLLRKRWDVSRAEAASEAEGGGSGGGSKDAGAAAADDDGARLVAHCRAALGPDHHLTVRAVEEHEGARRAARRAARKAAAAERGATGWVWKEPVVFVADEPPGG